MKDLQTESELRTDVVDTAGPCPFCGLSPKVGDVSCTRASDIDEEYFNVNCRGCEGWYEHTSREWVKPVAPGGEQERVRV